VLISSAEQGDCHASESGMTTFSMSKTPSNVAGVAAPMHVSQQCYLVGPAKVKSTIFLGMINIKILNKKKLKIKILSKIRRAVDKAPSRIRQRREKKTK
jgi:hypothetical protein